MTATLVRHKAEITPEVVFSVLPEDQQLADDAAKLLGYRILKKSLEQEANPEDQDFINALNALGIEPFENASVEAYKAEQVKKNSKRTRWGKAALASQICVGASLLTLAVSMIVAIATQSSVSALVMIGAFAPFAISVTALLLTTSHITSVKAYWTKRRIDLLQHPVPEFALQTAVDITKCCPHTKFYVDSMEVRSVVMDPFLYAKDKTGRRWYLEVWNEPKFSKAR